MPAHPVAGWVRAGATLADGAGLAGDRHRRLPGPQPLKDLDYLGGFRAGAGRGHRGGDCRADRGAFGQDGLGDQPEMPGRAGRLRPVGQVTRVPLFGLVEDADGVLQEREAGCAVLVSQVGERHGGRHRPLSA
jgi:hypothetical protein